MMHFLFYSISYIQTIIFFIKKIYLKYKVIFLIIFYVFSIIALHLIILGLFHYLANIEEAQNLLELPGNHLIRERIENTFVNLQYLIRYMPQNPFRLWLQDVNRNIIANEGEAIILHDNLGLQYYVLNDAVFDEYHNNFLHNGIGIDEHWANLHFVDDAVSLDPEHYGAYFFKSEEAVRAVEEVNNHISNVKTSMEQLKTKDTIQIVVWCLIFGGIIITQIC